MAEAHDSRSVMGLFRVSLRRLPLAVCRRVAASPGDRACPNSATISRMIVGAPKSSTNKCEFDPDPGASASIGFPTRPAISRAAAGIMNDSTIVVARATGNPGGRIARALLESGASAKALVRNGAAGDNTLHLLCDRQDRGKTVAKRCRSLMCAFTIRCPTTSNRSRDPLQVTSVQ
jgi:hypothetical protein